MSPDRYFIRQRAEVIDGEAPRSSLSGRISTTPSWYLETLGEWLLCPSGLKGSRGDMNWLLLLRLGVRFGVLGPSTLVPITPGRSRVSEE